MNLMFICFVRISVSYKFREFYHFKFDHISVLEAKLFKWNHSCCF